MEIIKNERTKLNILRIPIYIFLSALGAIFILPFFFMVTRGMMSSSYFLDSPTNMIPDKIMWENYINAFSHGGYGLPLLNSLLLCVINAAITPFSALLAAYAFTRLEWMGKKYIFAVMMATTMLPSVVTHVPLYVMYNEFNMLNTYYPLFLPNMFFAGAMNIFLARQFMVSHPKEIYESVKIDGAGPVLSFVYIAVPLSKTILIYLAISIFIGVWGDYYTPSIFLKNAKASERTFAYALYRNLWSDENNIHPEYVFSACTIISLVPMLCYAFFQKYLIQGIASAGIKG